MNEYVALVLQIIAAVAPAFIVYLTARSLITEHLGTLERVEAGRQRSERSAVTLPLRLQAYERLSLFCERIALPHLIARLQAPGQTAAQLKLSLFLGVQQEYEHNISQQVYMSQQLWDIIRQARDNALQAIESAAEDVAADRPAVELSRALLSRASASSNAGLAVALAAIKREAGLLLG